MLDLDIVVDLRGLDFYNLCFVSDRLVTIMVVRCCGGYRTYPPQLESVCTIANGKHYSRNTALDIKLLRSTPSTTPSKLNCKERILTSNCTGLQLCTALENCSAGGSGCQDRKARFPLEV